MTDRETDIERYVILLCGVFSNVNSLPSNVELFFYLITTSRKNRRNREEEEEEEEEEHDEKVMREEEDPILVVCLLNWLNHYMMKWIPLLSFH